MQITLIRHLPTEWNKKTWLQGRKDTELSVLTEKIITEIKQNQKVLNELAPFDLVLASTLKRTHQTANLYGFTPRSDQLLDELDFGTFEGMPKKRLLELHGYIWVKNPSNLVLGESIADFGNRVVSFIDKYRESGNILVFGHGAWIRALVSYSHYGHINNMNKLTVNNNECFTLTF